MELSRCDTMFRYGVVGLTLNLVGYLFFLLLLMLVGQPLTATGISYLFIVILGYLGNRHWAFRSSQTHIKDVPRYVLAYGIGFIVALAGMRVLSHFLDPAVAQVCVMILSAGVIYGCLLIFRFGK